MNSPFRPLIISACIIAALIFAFARSITECLMLSQAIIFIWLIPGYTAVRYAMPDLDDIEMIVLGLFAGYGLTAFILYFPNIFGLGTIRPLFGYIVSFVCIILLYFSQKNKKEAKSE